MSLTRSLRPAAPRHPLEIHPLARIEAGRLELLGPAFPPLGRLRLVLWHPGREPAFSSAAGRLLPGWRWEGEPAEGWVVLWLASGDAPGPLGLRASADPA